LFPKSKLGGGRGGTVQGWEARVEAYKQRAKSSRFVEYY